MARHEAHLSSGERDSPQPGDPSSKAACRPPAKSSATAGIPAEPIALVPQCSPEARLGDLARPLARQAARDLQLPAGASLDLGEVDGQVSRVPGPDQPSAGVKCGPAAPAIPTPAASHALISERPSRPNRGQG
jgi:hypothetical protein